jgi:hypothetical protein
MDEIESVIDSIDQFRLTTLRQLEREADVPRPVARAALESREEIDLTDCGSQVIVTIQHGPRLE